MKIGVIRLMLALVLIAACATAPPGPPATGELRLLKMEVPERIQAGVSYQVLLSFEANDPPPETPRACFFWTARAGRSYREGPYCFPVRVMVHGSPRTLTVGLRTNNPWTYTLDGYVEYVRGGHTQKSNEVSAVIEVRAP